jgi:hypothetical protein
MIPAMTLQTVVTFLKMPVLAISFIYTLFWRQTVSLNGENAETPEEHIFIIAVLAPVVTGLNKCLIPCLRLLMAVWRIFLMKPKPI